MEWEVIIKGSRKDHHEISVIKVSNQLGHQSWGWGGLDKIILFGSGLGKNQLNPATEEQWNEAMRITNVICKALNKEES